VNHGDRAIAHLCWVNRWSPGARRGIHHEGFEICELRSQMHWTLDISYLEQLAST
jgi:hypothetical protein